MKIKLKSPYANEIITIDETVNNTISQLINDTIIKYPNLINHESSKTITSIKHGFPPRPINLDEKLSDTNIRNGDQLICEVGNKQNDDSNDTINNYKGPNDNTNTTNQQNLSDTCEIPSVYIPELKKYLILRNIPDDNSCMFNALLYSLKSQLTPEDLRQIVISEIKSNSVKYNEIILGKSNESYCEWISKPESWGGAIELGIISKFFNIVINCIDIESGNFIKFENEDEDEQHQQPPNSFVNLIYSGIHYDVVITNDKLSKDDKLNDIGEWNILQYQQIINHASDKLCKLLQSKNYTTNTTQFRIRCLNCYKILVGELGASKHANETGHFNFGEVK